MNIKSLLIKSCITVTMLLPLTKTGFAQQQTNPKKTETVIFKLQKSDYEINGQTLQRSLSKMNGVTINKFCDKNNKIFLILQVDRTIQPSDDNITGAINAATIGFKKLDDSLIQNTISFCN